MGKALSAFILVSSLLSTEASTQHTDHTAPNQAPEAPQIVCGVGDLNVYFAQASKGQALSSSVYVDYSSARNDTGAVGTSLHVDYYEIRDDRVTFRIGQDSPLITVPLEDVVTIKRRADEQEAEEELGKKPGFSRPVVAVTVEFNGKSYEILANLNYRGDMKHPALVGRNLLSKANALVSSNCPEHNDAPLIAANPAP
jgi:hypothetical protein